jgi:hypothetical protein
MKRWYLCAVAAASLFALPGCPGPADKEQTGTDTAKPPPVVAQEAEEPAAPPPTEAAGPPRTKGDGVATLAVSGLH